MIKCDFEGREDRRSAELLRQGFIGLLTGVGNSMTPHLVSHQKIVCIPVTQDTVLKKKDIVLAKIGSRYYLHFIHAIKNGDRYLIGNAHGHMNGVVGRNCIFGKVVEKLPI